MMNFLTLYSDGGYPEGIPFDEPVVRFYALFILIGALLALAISNYRAYKEGYDATFFNMVFLIAFPCGIIGARIWYVIASWSQEFANAPFYHVFEIWTGGLAIQGGAIGGILAGVLFVFFARKGMPILKATDLAVPTILIAQAIGRWGNFFNSEVFGHAVSLEAWSFLPGFITNNMIGKMSSGVIIPSSGIAAPLFLVEGLINIMFYFVITEGLKATEGKYYKDGDQSFSYFIAYGIVRLILEPLRNPAFIMGEENGDKSTYNSMLMAIAFIIIGVILIIANHLFRYLYAKKILVLPAPFEKYLASRKVIKKTEASDHENSNSKDDLTFDDKEIKALEEKFKNEQDQQK